MRKQAINVLKALLAGGPDGGSSPVDAQYVGTALRRLTAQETMLLLEWADVSRDPTATWSVQLSMHSLVSRTAAGWSQIVC